jgi:hypothetical protein
LGDQKILADLKRILCPPCSIHNERSLSITIIYFIIIGNFNYFCNVCTFLYSIFLYNIAKSLKIWKENLTPIQLLNSVICCIHSVVMKALSNIDISFAYFGYFSCTSLVFESPCLVTTIHEYRRKLSCNFHDMNYYWRLVNFDNKFCYYALRKQSRSWLAAGLQIINTWHLVIMTSHLQIIVFCM